MTPRETGKDDAMKYKVRSQDQHVETRALVHGLLAGRTFDLSLTMCPNPLCPCRDIFLTVKEQLSDGHPPAKHSGKAEFLLDLRQRCLGQDDKGDPASMAFGRDFTASLTEADWGWFDEWWMDCRETQMSMADLDYLPATFPERVFEDLSCLVGYDEVVTFTGGLGFTFQGEPWAAVDSYCVNPECDCTSALLVLVPVAGRGPDTGKPGTCVDGFYSYDSKSFQVETELAAGPGSGELIAALRAGHPNLEAELAEHHRRLRILFRAELTRRIAAAHPGTIRKEPSVGRNAPCPCGSGKKFKRCCGA